jgi:hypothetical protein
MLHLLLAASLGPAVCRASLETCVLVAAHRQFATLAGAECIATLPAALFGLRSGER